MQIVFFGSGAGTRHQANAAVSVTAAVSPAAGLRHQAAAVLATTATVAPGGGIRAAGAAALPVAVTTASAARVTFAAAGALPAAVTTSADPRATYRGDAALSAAVTTTPEARATYRLTADLQTAITTAPAGGLHQNAAAALQTAITIDPVSAMRVGLAAALQAAITTTPLSSVRQGGGTNLVISLATTPDGHVLLAGAASLSGTATFTGFYDQTVNAAAALTALVSVTPNGRYARAAGIADLINTMTLLAVGQLLIGEPTFEDQPNRAWAVVYDNTDTTIVGVLPFVTPARILRQVNAITYWEMTVPELHETTALIQYGRYVRIYFEGVGLRARGVIEDWEITAQNETLYRRVWGRGLAAELSWENTYNGVNIVNQSASAGWTQLLARATGWTATTTGSGYQNQTARYDDQSLFSAAVAYGERAMGYVRETWTARQLELKNEYGSSGIILGNIAAHEPYPAANPSIAPLAGVPKIRSSGAVYNRYIAYGRASGAEPLTLQRSTRSGISSMMVNSPSVASFDYVDQNKNHESRGQNRFLLTFWMLPWQADAETIMSAGGRRMSFLHSAYWAPEDAYFGIYYLMNPPEGNIAFTADVPAAKEGGTGGRPILYLGGISMTVQDVDPVNPVRSYNVTTGSSTTPNVNHSATAGDLVLVSIIGNGSATATLQSGQTLIDHVNYVSVTRFQNTSYQVAAGGSDNYGATISPSRSWIIGAVSLRPALNYYMEDATSIAAHGGKPRVRVLSDVQLKVEATSSAVDLANQLADLTAQELAKTANPQEFYTTQPEQMPAAGDTLLPGDTFRFLYRGVVENESGRSVWKSIDSTQVVLAIEERLQPNRREWSLTHSASLGVIPGDNTALLAENVGDIRTLQVASQR